MTTPSGFIGNWFTPDETGTPPPAGPISRAGGVAVPTVSLPIKLPPNAIIYFESQADGTVIDPATGNELQNTEIVEVPAALRNQRVRMRDSPDVGFSRRSLLLMGYLLGDPANHATLDFSQEVDLTLKNGNGSEISGKFFFLEKPNPYYDSILVQIGTPIFGELKLAGSGETF